MATSPKKANTPISLSHRTTIPLNGEHLSTCDFMDFNIAKKMELVPGQSIDVQHAVTTRLEPMVVPTFGDAQIHNKAFFVPYRTVFPAWNDFITDVAHVYPDGSVSHVSRVPCFYLNDILYMFSLATDLRISSASYTQEQVDELKATDEGIITLESYDLFFYAANNRYQGINLSRKGRRFLKILLSLGYTVEVVEVVGNVRVSALPLLSVGKIYLDWYYPQAYLQDERAQIVSSYFNRDVPNFTLTKDDIYNILSVIDVVNYDNDFYTGAWDNPANSTDGSYTDINIYDVTSENPDYRIGGMNAEGTAEISANASLTQYGLTALRAASDYAKRNQLAGSRAIDRYLARYGVTLDSAKLNRSMFLHEYNDFIQFGDVTATASTDTAILGDFAGKGIGYTKNSFDFSTDEYGMLFIITTIVPRIGYFQGIHRENMHLSKLDFFTGEFDALGVQAVSQGELYMPLNVLNRKDLNTDVTDAVFGFVPRYGHYKVGYDQLTGDYRLGRLNRGRDAWTLFRDVKQFFKDGDGVHDINFVRGVDNDQYQRIFSYTEDGADHFNIHHQFAIKSSFPARSLYDNYEFENEDEAKKVSLNVNGVKAN